MQAIVPAVLLIGVASVVVVLIWQTFATIRARGDAAERQRYEELADRCATALERIEASQRDAAERVRWIEQTLRDVD